MCELEFLNRNVRANNVGDSKSDASRTGQWRRQDLRETSLIRILEGEFTVLLIRSEDKMSEGQPTSTVPNVATDQGTCTHHQSETMRRLIRCADQRHVLTSDPSSDILVSDDDPKGSRAHFPPSGHS